MEDENGRGARGVSEQAVEHKDVWLERLAAMGFKESRTALKEIIRAVGMWGQWEQASGRPEPGLVNKILTKTKERIGEMYTYLLAISEKDSGMAKEIASYLTQVDARIDEAAKKFGNKKGKK